MTSALYLPLLAETTTEGPVRWPGAPPAWACVVLLAALVFAVRWIYRRERQKVSRPLRILLGGLRTLAVVLVALALFRPERELVTKVTDKSHLVVMLDTSASMATTDRYPEASERRILAAAYPEDGPEARPAALDLSRLGIVQKILAGPSSAALRSLSDRFVVHVFGFDEDLRSLASTEPAPGDAPVVEGKEGEALGKAVLEAKPTGQRTDLGAALKAVSREFLHRDDRRLAGVVMLTDGRDNAEAGRPEDAVLGLGRAAEDLRLSVVALGDPRLAKNVRVDRVTAKDVVLVQDTPTFLAELRQVGFDGATGVEARLEILQVAGPDGKAFPTPRPYVPKPPPGVSADAAPAGRSRVPGIRLGPSAVPTAVTLRETFYEAGTYDVKVHVVLPEALAKDDAIADDNVLTHRLRVVDQTIKVLLVDGNLRYESWFLKNLLVRESRHPGDPRRIDAQVWIQSFDEGVEKPHSRDLPALRAFPTTRQELFAYDVIVIGDVDWRRLVPSEERSRDILGILKDFVAEGGGVAFVAGEDRNPTQYLDTPLQDLLPVSVRPTDREKEGSRATSFRIAPTEIGREHPILGMLQDGSAEAVDRIWRGRDGWDWFWLYRARGGLKPGAVALARVFGQSSPEFLDDRQEPLVVFAGMGYGRGRTFFSAVDQIYRIRREHGDRYYGSFWDETIRWLATYRLLGGNKRYKIETDKDEYFVGETATIKVSALDADYRPLRDPVLRGLQVEGPDGKPLLAEADAARPDPEGSAGLYRTSLRLATSGPYRITVDPPTRDGGARAEKRIEARFATREAQDKVPDHEGLKALVRVANPAGVAPRLYAPYELGELVESLPARGTERILDRKSISLWDTPWTLALVTAILALEWILRKRMQMI